MPEVNPGLAEHMKDFGLHMVGKGIVNATFSECYNPYAHAMSIVHIAHGAEILFKARIVEQNPLLIFSNYPKWSQSKKEQIDFIALLETEHTIKFSALPKILSVEIGYDIDNSNLFTEFGKLRNEIVHLKVPHLELNDLALNFTFRVIERAVNDWWDKTIFNYAVNYDEVYLEYAFEQLHRLDIKTKYSIDDNFNLTKHDKQ